MIFQVDRNRIGTVCYGTIFSIKDIFWEVRQIALQQLYMGMDFWRLMVYVFEVV